MLGGKLQATDVPLLRQFVGQIITCGCSLLPL